MPFYSGRGRFTVANLLQVEVVYVGLEKTYIVPLQLKRGMTVGEAIAQSGIVQQCAEIDPAKNRIGIFGRFCSPDDFLQDGDRVEIYRPLKTDPKEARRKRAGKTKK